MGKLGTPSNLSNQEKIMKTAVLTVALVVASLTAMPNAQAKSSKSMFYDFQGQLIDGEVKVPTAQHTGARGVVEFERLLSLKKSLERVLFSTSKDRLFK
jgi:hypothetical protein